MTYEKSFKIEAVKLSDEIGIKKAADQLGIPYYTLADWRHRQNVMGEERKNRCCAIAWPLRILAPVSG